MLKYGVKIKNYEAASIYEYNHGLRNNLDTTDAMLVNSLFLDYLLNEDLIKINKESTRDVICLQFDYGTKSTELALKNLAKKLIKYKLTSNVYNTLIRNILKNRDCDYQLNESSKRIIKAIKRILDSKNDCKALSREELRVLYYTRGLQITYKTKKGKSEKISYKMLYRTPGKAKKGTCMFINKNIYEQVRNFLYMGIKLPQNNTPIVEIGAYSSLITSSIVDRIQIYPHQILTLKDVESEFKTNVQIVKTDDKCRCYVESEENYSVKNTLFDGQALIDTSIFPESCDGYILLRHHLTKMAAFHCDIQLFMKDYFGNKYETATVTDMFGRELRAKDIKLITTDNAFKWLKFKVSFEYWASWIEKNDCYFGIVKTTHPSKLGDVQRMSYQMVNAMDMDSMDDVVKRSLEYVDKLKLDDAEYLKYLEKNATFSNDYLILKKLAEHNVDFIKSTYFRERRKKIINTYVLNLKYGHIIQDADNLTIVGSPYAMLLHSVGEDPLKDDTFSTEVGCIQCYTPRFGEDEYLAEFRNPFNSRNNLGYLHNVSHKNLTRYFKLGTLCIAVNMIKTDFQSRNNGSDQDSDSIYVTNHPAIVKHAKYCYENYPTIVNDISQEKNKYKNKLKDFAIIDNQLAAAQLAIGESSNLAQLCLTYTYNLDDKKYQDFVCILSVLAQVAIDNAKRKYNIDLTKEIKRIKTEMGIKKIGYPKFWLITKRDKRKVRSDEERIERDRQNKEKIRKTINDDLICPMNKLYDMTPPKYHNTEKSISTDRFIEKPNNIRINRKKAKNVEDLILKYSFEKYKNDIFEEDRAENYELLRNNFEELISDIRRINISSNYYELIYWLLNRAFLIGTGAKNNKDRIKLAARKNRPLLIKTLHDVNPKVFFSCFKKGHIDNLDHTETLENKEKSDG